MNEWKIINLLTDYDAQPMGIIAPPNLSWELTSDANDVFQSACRIQYATDPDFSVCHFDSGEIAHTDNAHYRSYDLPLQSAQRYYWRAWVRTNHGDTAWSAPASFVTGLIEGFQGDMITAETAEDKNSDHATALMRDFEITGEIEAAYVYATAYGIYHLMIDGERISDYELAPGWTSYHKHLQYQTYDITPYCTSGKHLLSAWLGSGWYKGLMGILNIRNNYGDVTGLLCQIEIRYKDGRRERILSDNNWRGAKTPVLFSDIYNGETYDARLGVHDSLPVSTLSYRPETLSPQPSCAVKVIQTLPVREIITTDAGETVLDFGQNLTGFVRLKVSGKAGDIVKLQCFEILDPVTGNVYTKNLRKAAQTLTYILKGDGEEIYQPLFTFQGFQYVQVISYPTAIAKEDIVACVVHSDMQETGQFECSNPLLNQLWHNVLWGLKGNFVDVPTDCPQRDERLGWTGDAQIFSGTACCMMNVYPFFRKWLKDLALDQTAEGGVPHIVPDNITDHEDMNNNWLMKQSTHSASGWADAAVIIPWNLYLTYGDKDILLTQYPSMKGWVNFMRNHATDNHFDYRHQLGDWVALDAAEGSYYGATPTDLVCMAYYAYCARLLGQAAQVIGNTDDAREYKALSESICQSFTQDFYTADGEMTAQTQTAHILALHFDLIPQSLRAKTLEGLQHLLDEQDGHLQTGFIGTPYFTYALSGADALDKAYDLLLKEDFPSWLYQIKRGATTIWEHWDGIKPDGSMWSAGMNSFNHYAYGAIGEWMYHVIGGIQPDQTIPGYRHAILAPKPGGGLTFAKSGAKTAYGTFSLDWEIKENTLHIKAIVPCNTTATLVPPVDGAPKEELSSGTHLRSYPLSKQQ